MSPKSVKKASSKPLQKKASKKVEKVTEKCSHRCPSGLQNRLKLLPGASPKQCFLENMSQRCPKRLPGASAGASGTPNRRKKYQKTTKNCWKIMQKIYTPAAKSYRNFTENSRTLALQQDAVPSFS